MITQLSFLSDRKVRREAELNNVASYLDKRLPGSFMEILQQKDSLNKPVDEQVLVLNAVLQPIIDDVSLTHPGIGLGYYYNELDHILAIGPEFNTSKLKQMPQNLQYFNNIYETGKPVVTYSNSSDGWKGKSIINLAYPIYRNGKIIGHTWANVKMEDVYAEAWSRRWKILATGPIILGATLIMSWLAFRRFKTDLESFANAVVHNSDDLPKGIMPEFKSILDEVKKHTEELQKEISERIRTEEELRLSEERFSKAFNSIPVSMVITLLDDGTIIDANENFLHKFGYIREEVIGHTTPDLKLFENIDDRAKIIHLIKEQGSVCNCELIYNKKSGDTFVGLHSGVALTLLGKQCIFTVINDITELRMLQKEISRLDRLNLIGEMAAGIGHEIRNPMTTVRGFLQLLSKKEECTNYKGYFNLMIDELDRANTIISEFLSLAKNKTVELTMVNLKSILENLFPLIQADAIVSDKYINLDLGTVPELLLDEKEIRQLVLNLVRNALESMSPGGKMNIRTFMDQEEIVLAVQDDGKGIATDVLEKLGTPFFTTKENGTGLGLAVCYSICSRYNAKIDIETNPHGTTFFVRFKN